MKDKSAPKILTTRLQSALFKERLVYFVAGLMATAASLLTAWLFLSILANFVVLPVWIKIVLLAVTGLLTVFLLTKLAVLKFFSGSIDSVAVNIEQKNPGLKGRLIAAIQFSRLGSGHGYSEALLDSTRSQAIERAENVNFNEIITLRPLFRSGRALVAVIAFSAALLFIFPGLFGYSYEVYSQPATEIAPPIAYQLEPFPGSTKWVKHRDIKIGASIIGQRIPEGAKIYYRLAGGSWQKSEHNIPVINHIGSDYVDSLEVAITLRQVNRSFDYYVRAGRLETEIQHIDVVDRPRVTKIKLDIFYPKYTSLQPLSIDENNGSFSAIIGSRVNMKITANLPVETALLIFDDSSQTDLAVEHNSGQTTLEVTESRSYYLRLTDNLGEVNPDPIEYYISAIPDEYPSVDVLRPGFDANLTDEMAVPFKIRIFDDFGFSSLVLKYSVVKQGRRGDENVAVLHFSDNIKTEGDIDFEWDLNPFRLYPGDYVSYFFEVTDNDAVSGPKTSKSRTYIVRLPSLDELIAGSEAEGEKRIVNTEEIIKTGKELVERLKKAERKLDSQNRNNQSADWQQQKELESIVKKNESLLEQIEQLSEQMESSLDEQRENALMSREIQEKMEQIQKLFEDIATPEMKEAQKKLMEALKNMDRQQIEQAMKEFELSQQEMLERLERTLALLKKMQLEQKMEAMIRKAEELVQRQDDVNEQTESADKKSLPELSKNEDEIKEGLDNLKKEIAELQELMKEAKLEQSPEAQKFSEAVEKTDADENMKNMSKSLEQQQRDNASSEGKKAKSKLAEMLNEMQQQKMAMSGNSDSEIQKAMRRAIDDANYLSRSQEDLLREAATLNPQSTIVRELAGNQQDIAKSSQGLKEVIAELGKKTPFIAAELTQLLNSATSNMDMASKRFEARNPGIGLRHQRSAMTDLNKAALRLMESMDQQKQCNNAGSCDKPTQGLESLSQKQNQLNQETQRLGNNPQPNFQEGSPGREALKRLAGEQGSIRKTLEELEKEFGGSRQILGRLKDIVREMKEIEESLSEGDVGSDIRERQLKVYSRMLEASRSLQRKDFSEQRKSQVATSPAILLPPELSASILDDRTNIEDKLRHFLGDEYPSQYEDQIKAYFRALLKLETEQSTEIAPSQTPGTNQ